jgi:integrase
MRTTYQRGSIQRKVRRNGPDVWVLRYFDRSPGERPRYVARLLGTVGELPTKRHAERIAEAIRLEINSPVDQQPVMTFGGLIERYKLDKMPDRYSTSASYLSCLKVHISPRWGDMTLEQIAKLPYQVEKWFENLELAPKTKGHIKGLMHRLFECAMKWGLYPVGRNPMELVEIKNVSKRMKRPRVLSREEFLLLLPQLQEPYRIMVLTAQCLGLRTSEVMALQWSDFDFENLMLRVQRGIVHGRVDDVKTEYSLDDLPLDPDYAEVMQTWRSKCPVTEEGWVFANPTTEMPYWQETVAEKQIKPAAVRAGIGLVGWHTFRHTYRTWLDGAGAPISIQRELMRHASIQTTMNVYGRSMMSEAKRAANSNVVRMALRPVEIGAKQQRSQAAP